MIKVLVVSTSYPLDNESSSGIFVLRLVEEIANKCQVTVLTPDNTQQSHHYTIAHSNNPIVVQTYRYAPKCWQLLAHNPGGIPVALKNNPVLYLLLPVFIVGMLYQVAKMAPQHDVIHANWAITGLLAGLIGFLFRRPVVTTLRGDDVAKQSSSRIKNIILSGAVKFSQKIITVSTAIETQIKSNYPHRSADTLTIPNGINSRCLIIGKNRLEATLNKGNIHIITVGSLIPRKGLDVIIRAISQLKDKTQVKLSIVGDGPELKPLQTLVSQLQLIDMVHFTGPALPDNIPNLLAEADIFVLASHSEGRPNVILESMATGLAIIAANIDGVNELVLHAKTGLLFNDGDSEELAVHLSSLIADSNNRRQLGNSAYQFIIQQNLTWANAANRYLDIYRQVS